MIGLNPSISDHDFAEILETISMAGNVDELIRQARARTAISYGSYHHIPAIGSFDYDRLSHFWSIGFNQDVEDYFKKKGFTADPVMKTVLSDSRPYWLSSLLNHKHLSDGRSQHRLHLALEHVGDGIVAPLFGPFKKRGYIYLGFGKSREFYDSVFLWQIYTILQTIHIRYSKLVQSLRISTKLTKREGEVLELICFGKTNPEIGIILGISTSTVAGHVKRIFLKLNANDRVTAALRAQSFRV